MSADRETGISGWAAGASCPPTRHAQEALPYVFDAYFTTKPVGLGSGLGLASVRDIVRGAGGQITVHSRPGLGATFRLWLPVVTDIQAASRPQAGGRTQVVVLDRDPDVTRLVSRILSASGMDVHLASSAAEALALAEQLPAFDLLLTDVSPSAQGGQPLAQRIETEHQRTGSLFMSGDGVPDWLCGRPFISKPFAPTELLCSVKQVLSATSPAGPRRSAHL